MGSKTRKLSSLSVTAYSDIQIEERNSTSDELETLLPPKGISLLETIVLLQFNEVWLQSIAWMCYVDTLGLINYEVFYILTERFYFLTLLDNILFWSILLDTILKIYYISANLKEKYLIRDPPITYLLCDFTASIPAGKICQLLTGRPSTFCYHIDLNKLLRFTRVIQYFGEQHANISKANKYFNRLTEFCAYITLAAVIYATISFIFVKNCGRKLSLECEFNWSSLLNNTGDFIVDERSDWMWLSLFKGLCLLAFNGMNQAINFALWETIVFASLGHVTFCWFCCYYIGQFHNIAKSRIRERFIYYETLSKIKSGAGQFNYSKNVIDKIMEYCKYSWTNFQGVTNTIGFEEILPASMYKDMHLDMFWDAFQHSHLFRKARPAFLRNVAVLMEQKFYLPGDFIFEKDEWKDRMIYLVKGVIEVLSPEDENTAILSLSPGTCFGETTLVQPYTSLLYLRCRTACIIHVLTRESFVKISTSYMQDYSLIQSMVWLRYKEARWHEEVTRNIDPNSKYNFTRSVLTLRYLKFKIGELLNRTSTEFDEKLLEVNSYDRLQFSGKYMDMISISDKFELVVDSVVIKSGCPFILRNDSEFLRFWNRLILILSMISVIVLPFNLSFTDEIPHWHDVFVHFITYVWIIDIYLQLSTSYDTREELVAEMDRIVLEHLSHVYFWIELCAAFPIDMMVAITPYNQIPRLVNFFQLNRILKIYRFNRQFMHLENSLHYSVSGLECVKIIFFACIYLYLMASLICFANFVQLGNFRAFIWHKQEESNIVRFFKYLYVVTKLTSRSEIEDISPSSFAEIQNMSLLLILTIIIDMLIKSNLIAIYLLDSVRYIDVFERHWKMERSIRTYRLNNLTQKRIKQYMAYAVEFRKNFEVSQYFKNVTPPDGLRAKARADLFRNFFTEHPAFKNAHPGFINELCQHLIRKLLPVNEVLIYKRDSVPVLYIICAGFCKLMQNKYYPERCLRPGDMVALLEFFLKRPSLHTIILQSTCYFVSINYTDFMKVLYKYPLELEIMEEILKTSEEEFNAYKPLRTVLYNTYKPYMRGENPSYVKFQKDDENFDEIDYTIEFNRSIFGFFRPFLLRRTYLPEGRFLIYWEIQRCIFALTSAILFSNPIIIFSDDFYWISILKILDSLAYTDLYVQMHTCYYNQDNVLVTHPLRTCLHYLSHRFLLDLFACFQFDLIFTITTNWMFVLTKLNRVVQCYRMIGFVKYIYGDKLQGLIVLKFIGFLIIIFVLSSTVAAYLLSFHCHFGKEITSSLLYDSGVNCTEDSWISKSIFSKPLSPTQVYLYGLYFSTSLLTLTGHDGLSSNSHFTAMNIMTITILAYIGNFLFLNTMIYGIYFRSQELLQYKEQISSLLRYISSDKISNKFRSKLLEHYQRVWNNRGRLRIFRLSESFHGPFRQDILFECFYSILVNTRAFRDAEDDFFRRILMEMKYETIIRNQDFLKCHDVINNLYFIVSGRIDIYDKYGDKIANLSSGSIFGNIIDQPSIKHDYLVTTSTFTRILIIKTNIFYPILKLYPSTYDQFIDTISHIKSNNYDTKFIINREDPINQETDLEEQVPDKMIILPNSKLSLIWEFFFVYFIVFFQFVVEVYCVGVTQTTPNAVYILDILYLINMVIFSITAYEDEDGIIVSTRKEVLKHYFKSCGFVLDVIVMLPLNVIARLTLNRSERRYIKSWYRINKLLCIHHFLTNIRKRQSFMGTNMFFTRLFIVLTWTYLLIHFTACIQLGFLRYNDIALHLPDIELSQFHLYIMHAYSVQNIFFSSVIHGYYPNSPYMTIYFIVMMMIFRLTQYLMVAEICSSLSDTLVNRNEYYSKLFALKNYMKFGDISEELFRRKWTFALRLWSWCGGKHFPVLLKTAPHYLLEEINGSLYGDIFYEHPIFWKCEYNFLRQMIRYLKYHNFFTEDYIAFEGDTTNSLYIVQSGVVGVETTIFLEEQEELAKVRLSRGSVFAIPSGLIKHQKLTYTYKALITCIILELNYFDWKYLLEHFPDSKKNMYEQFEDGLFYFQELREKSDEYFH